MHCAGHGGGWEVSVSSLMDRFLAFQDEAAPEATIY